VVWCVPSFCLPAMPPMPPLATWNRHPRTAPEPRVSLESWWPQPLAKWNRVWTATRWDFRPCPVMKDGNTK
jgi:hypothetical protein